MPFSANALILAGVVLILAGLAFKFGLLDWFGNLPGDIKYGQEHTRLYFPVTSMLAVSIVFSLLLWWFRR